MDQTTSARVNLNAVLRTLEKLPALDPPTAELVTGEQVIVQFTAPRAATVRLALGGGAISHHQGPGPATINLLFPRPAMVNAMFDGTGNPIPTKGLRRISYLKGPFTQITDRLSHFLRPTPELLADADYCQTNALLTLHVAVYALAEIGNSDQVGRAIAATMPDGQIQLAIKGGPALVLSSQGGRLRVTEGLASNRRAKMVFTELGAAGEVLRGELASYTAIGRGLIELGGFVPMLDRMNKLLGLVPRYLGQEA